MDPSPAPLPEQERVLPQQHRPDDGETVVLPRVESEHDTTAVHERSSALASEPDLRHTAGLGGPDAGTTVLDDLPGVSDEALDPDGPGPGRRPSGRSLALGAAAVVLLVAAGLLGLRYAAGADLRRALSVSTESFNDTVRQLTAAGTAAQLGAAAGAADRNADRLDRQLRELSGDSGSKGDAVRRQIEAEKRVLVALATLGPVVEEPLGTWASAYPSVTAALEAEQAARRGLRAQDEDAAQALADTDRMLEAVVAAVGPALVDDATSEAGRLLGELEAAQTTGDLRSIAGAVQSERTPVTVAGKALPEGEGKQVLTAYGDALTAMGELSAIDGEHASGWPEVRAELAQTLGVVAGAGAPALKNALDEALTNGDGVVGAATRAITDWRARTEAATKARTTDTEALDGYAAAFRAQSARYAQLRKSLSAFTDRVEDPTVTVTYEEGYDFLSRAAEDRREVRDTMIALTAPDGIGESHQAVIDAVDRGVLAVQSAYDGLVQSQDCFYYDDCPYYRDTPGWQEFQSESTAISKAYAAATARWGTDVTTAKAAISRRPLPEKPDV